MVYCQNNLHQLGIALGEYHDREGTYPPYAGKAYLRALCESGVAADRKLFECRSEGTDASGQASFSTDYAVNPVLAGQGAGAYDAVRDTASMPWAWDGRPFHENNQGPCRCVLFLDGHVRIMGEADFQAMLAKGTE